MRKIIKIISTFLLTILTPFNINAIKIPDLSEKDFLNSMFLRSEFFENWSDTNFFVNPTLKTSKPLKYQENWYLDFLKDSYSTGISYDKPADAFLDLYKNWEKYANQFQITGFYNIDKINFLKNLTNFIYTFVQNQNMTSEFQKLQSNIKDLNLINLKKQGKWEIVSDKILRKKSGWYFVIKTQYQDSEMPFVEWAEVLSTNFPDFRDIEYNDTSYTQNKYVVYKWTGENQPNKPKIDVKTGEITDWNENIK